MHFVAPRASYIPSFFSHLRHKAMAAFVSWGSDTPASCLFKFCLLLHVCGLTPRTEHHEACLSLHQ